MEHINEIIADLIYETKQVLESKCIEEVIWYRGRVSGVFDVFSSALDKETKDELSSLINRLYNLQQTL